MSEPYKPLDLSKYEGNTPGPWKWDQTETEDHYGIPRRESGTLYGANEDVLVNTDSGFYLPYDVDRDLIGDATAILTDAREARKVIAALAFALEIARGRILAEDDECNLSYSYHTVTHALSLAAPWVERA